MATRKSTVRRTATKKTTTRKHEVRAELTNVELVKAKSALKLEVFVRHEKLGELEVGRGSIYWRGANRQLRKRVDWTRFAEMMDNLAYGAR
ncbi:hypothetical protein LF41_1058 [Lysobacter dokdonensis DS-58]|uniref:Uncharacterized protein n=1 Tax=Lysobacter dokdonensis DS-58 TaxID=1300345 RepID=A0A0A2WK11_9GAMM|nr:hypothetical protein [Lysobacter dokdonensis]KGQ20521.1 hypothetical protein LF41_1058 [Lysobacter dokdonensis DS-58]